MLKNILILNLKRNESSNFGHTDKKKGFAKTFGMVLIGMVRISSKKKINVICVHAHKNEENRIECDQ